MIKPGELVFVDSGAWIALALTRDPLHARARTTWDELDQQGVKARTSIPVVLETFTFLERNVSREIALTWKDRLTQIARFKLLECTARDVEASWAWFRRRDLHKLSAVDATSFTLMRRKKIHAAFTFDQHFAQAGFRVLG